MVLDFNALTQPTLDIILKDDDRTKLQITVPSQALIRRLQTGIGELKTILDKKDETSLRKVWELTAELMSYNLQMIKITADELTDKYRFELSDLLIFLQYYLDFVKEAKSAKN